MRIYNHNALDGTWLMGPKELFFSLFLGRLQIRPCIAEASETTRGPRCSVNLAHPPTREKHRSSELPVKTAGSQK